MSTQLPTFPWKNMADQVSFKVTLREDVSDETKSKSQVRRFVVPQDCSTSLVYLKEKVRSIFGPTLFESVPASQNLHALIHYYYDASLI